MDRQDAVYKMKSERLRELLIQGEQSGTSPVPWRTYSMKSSASFKPSGPPEDWRRARCEGQEGEIRTAGLGLSLPLRELYTDVLADWAIEPWRDAALRTG
jgi:hypothetical protein